MYKMSDQAVWMHLWLWGSCICGFVALSLAPRLLIRWIGRLPGIALWLAGLLVLGGVIVYLYDQGTSANGFLD